MIVNLTIKVEELEETMNKLIKLSQVYSQQLKYI